MFLVVYQFRTFTCRTEKHYNLDDDIFVELNSFTFKLYSLNKYKTSNEIMSAINRDYVRSQ